jgi:Fe-S-cluster containining protein
MINKKDFKCTQCGDCCIHTIVKLYKEDIKKLEKAGYNNFYMYDSHIESPVLKRNDNGCIFLELTENKPICSIYKIRPKVCKIYPFNNSNIVESCKPALMKLKGK